VDLGEIHPAALTDGQETVIISSRALRSNAQYTAKRLSEIQAKQVRKQRGSRAFRRLQRRKSRFLAKQRRRARDLEHKISRAVVDWAKERQVGTLVVGDVRDVADGKHLNTKSQQKIGLWSHGRQRQYITYKANATGITVALIKEAYTSQTCPGTLSDGTGCMQCYKPRGRLSRCPACGFDFPSRWGRLCQLARRGTIRASQGMSNQRLEKYRYPNARKRSRLDTADPSRIPTIGKGAS
jgi:putative transposase